MRIESVGVEYGLGLVRSGKTIGSAQSHYDVSCPMCAKNFLMKFSANNFPENMQSWQKKSLYIRTLVEEFRRLAVENYEIEFRF